MISGIFLGIQEKNDTFALTRRFVAHKGEKATLKATTLGIYVAYLNGKRIGDAFYAPGWTSYPHTLQVQEYDVSSLLQEGENILCFCVSGGWYCSGLGFAAEGPNLRYGEKPALLAELSLENKTIATDLSWEASECPIVSSGLYAGETQDYTKSYQPLTPCEVPGSKSVLIPQQDEPVREIERIPAKTAFLSPKGEWIYDFGQNLTGVVELTTPEDFDGKIVCRFSEVLNHGCLYPEGNRHALSTDTFIVKGKRTMAPLFTFHGFRYVRLEGARLPLQNVVAIVRHTDLHRTGHLTTSNVKLQKLLDNIVWSQRDNSLDIPTDCPQRDERMGWTGDTNVFLGTAAFNYDVRRFYEKWLRDLRADQAPSGEISQVTPDILGWKNTAAVWCDAICMVPWTLYEMYGESHFLTDNLAAMKKYLVALEATMVDGIVVKGQQYGDWLACDQERFALDIWHGRTDSYFLASVFALEDLRIIGVAARFAKEEDFANECEEKYRLRLRQLQDAYFTKTGRFALDTVTAKVLALHFHVVPESGRATMAKELNEQVIANQYRTITGIVGTRYLLFALAENGYFETAGKVLLNEQCPGWLYEVNQGATTMWEKWDGITPDGNLDATGMCSYNHPFFGSVMEFVYRRIAGIDFLEPGFARIQITPHYVKGIEDIEGTFDSPRGLIHAGYHQKNGKVTYFALTPSNVPAVMTLPNGETKEIQNGHLEVVVSLNEKEEK